MKDFKNIIFDFGGVLIDIAYEHVIDAFHKLELKDFDKLYTQLNQHHLFDNFEMGKISTDEFRKQIRKISSINLSDDQIDNAWNAILIGLPKENVDLLMRLKKNFRLFLLSNTNAIHEVAFTKMIKEDFGENILEKAFEGIYFSHHLGMRKPDSDIFLYVLEQNNLAPEETLFIDDSPQHIEGAKKIGLQTLYLEKGKTILEFFHG